MFGEAPASDPRLRRRSIIAVVLAAVLAAPSPGRAADGLWDAMLEKLNVKASPPAPGPDFVERSRPDLAALGYQPTATPHKVSPLPVKTPDQIQAEKDALDLARKRQLDPGAPKPLQSAKAAPAGSGAKGRSAPKPPAVAD